MRTASDGSLDRAFGAGGIARLPVWGDHEFANAVAVQSDGRIVGAGTVGDPARSRQCTYPDCGACGAVLRLLPEGRVDPSSTGAHL